jgi:hypothetical protein
MWVLLGVVGVDASDAIDGCGHGLSATGACQASGVTRSSRIAWFGLAGALVACGVLCAVLVDGTTGKVLCLVLASTGLVGAVLLAFLEVGLSEDRERSAHDERDVQQATRRLDAQRRRPRPRRR